MKKILAIALIFTLTACQNAPNAYVAEPFAFENAATAPMRITVANITIVDHHQSPMKRPNVEHEFPVSPTAAVKKWVAHRVQAVGTSGTLEITINEADVKEMPLPKTQGVKGLFTDDQDARYDAKISVTFRLRDGTSIASRATGDVEVTKSRSINERATVFEREAIYHAMIRDIMTRFDSEANARLRQYFSAVLK